MTTEITKAKTFEEKMKERIKDSIGGLISDEDLSKLVKKGIEDAFFSKKIKVKRYYSDKDEYEPIYMESVIKDILGEKIKDISNKYLNENADKLNAMYMEAIKDGFIKMMVAHFDNKINTSLSNINQGKSWLNQP